MTVTTAVAIWKDAGCFMGWFLPTKFGSRMLKNIGRNLKRCLHCTLWSDQLILVEIVGHLTGLNHWIHQDLNWQRIELAFLVQPFLKSNLVLYLGQLTLIYFTLYKWLIKYQSFANVQISYLTFLATPKLDNLIQLYLVKKIVKIDDKELNVSLIYLMNNNKNFETAIVIIKFIENKEEK